MGGDFFEDQIEEAPSKGDLSKQDDSPSKKDSDAAKGSSSEKTGKLSSKAISNTLAEEEPAGTLSLPQKVDLIWAITFVVVAFVAGFIIRGVFTPQAAITPTVTNTITNPVPGVPGAPELTQDQVNSGELPEGHPKIDGAGDQPNTAGTPGDAVSPDDKSGTSAADSGQKDAPSGETKTEEPAKNN